MHNVTYEGTKKPVIALDLIELNCSAKTWEEAVLCAGMLLVNHGYAENIYINAMLKSVNELGPYIVIYPGFALPHAKLEKGVFHTGLSFIRLKKPVYFPKKSDDPVHTIIALCTNGSRDHIKTLQKIALIFRNERLIDTLQKSKNKEVIFDLLNIKLGCS